MCGSSGPGYFKLERAEGAVGAPAGPPSELLVVAFGSAPGVPNWGGILRRVRDEAEEPAHKAFDVLYVVDPERCWYRGGGGDAEFAVYAERLAEAARGYRRVLMLGDSMGATAALLFAGQATAVHAFCPQVDLSSCSIRPAAGAAAWAVLQRRVLEGLGACPGSVTVHVGNWKHDLDQVNVLPQDAPNLQVKIYSVDSHRLALALDRTGRLLTTLRSAILNEMDIPTANVRIANLF